MGHRPNLAPLGWLRETAGPIHGGPPNSANPNPNPSICPCEERQLKSTISEFPGLFDDIVPARFCAFFPPILFLPQSALKPDAALGSSLIALG